MFRKDNLLDKDNYTIINGGWCLWDSEPHCRTIFLLAGLSFPVAADMLTGPTFSQVLPYKQLPTQLLWYKAVHIGAVHTLFSSKRKFDSGALVCQFMLYYPRVLSLISPILSCSSLVVAGDGSLKQNA